MGDDGRGSEEKGKGKGRRTCAWTAEHEYHRHFFFVEYGLGGRALGSISALVGAGEVQGISDLLYDVGSHRGLDQESVRARRAGGRSGGGVRMRGLWLRGGGRERNMRRRKREQLRRREPGLVRLWV